MNPFSCFVPRPWVIFCAVIFACSFSAAFCDELDGGVTPAYSLRKLPDEKILKYEVKPLTPEQVSAQQLQIIERRAVEKKIRSRNITAALFIMFLFGSFSALWAQNTGRNAWVWFFLGFGWNVIAIFLILWINPREPRKRHKKRSRGNRGIKDYWNLALS